MLSVSSAKNSNYYTDLAREDYYQNGQEPPGHWIGAGAAQLRLKGQVQAGELANLFSGFDPKTGQKLASNAGQDNHKSGWDMTFSCPKSVSAVWAVNDEQTRQAISLATRLASEKALSYFADEAVFTRHGHGGHEHQNAKNSIIAASFEHSSSRNGEPQLHRHILLMNCTPEGRGLDIDLRAKMAAGALFRAELASQLQELGYSIKHEKQEFQIVGVPDRLCSEWSSRRQEIQNVLHEKGFSSAKASEVACLSTRNSKDFFTREGLAQTWQEQAAAHGFDPKSCKCQVQEEKLETPTPDSVFKRLTSQASTFSKFQLQAEVFRQCQGVMDAQAAQDLSTKVLKEAITLQGRDGLRYTSPEMLKIESEMAAIAQGKQGEAHPINAETRDQIAQEKSLSAEQKQMVEHITGVGGVKCVEGMAGTGKSYALGAAREIWEGAGYKILGLAPTAKAASGLQEGSGITSQTIHLALAQIRHGNLQLDKKTVLIVDEAGMCGSRLVHPLLEAAQAAGAKVVFVGDSKQLQPIDAGGAFRALSKRLGAAQLTDIRRQKVQWLKEAVQDFAAGEAGKALAAYKENGALRLAPTQVELNNKMVQDWHSAPAAAKDKIMLAASNHEVQNLNKIARKIWKKEGRLGSSCVVKGQEFCEGERLVCLKNNRTLGLQNGTRATLERINYTANGLRLNIQTDEGQRINVDPSQYDHFAHGYAMTCHKAQGMTVGRCFMEVNAGMSDREWTYVAASHAREETQMYCTTEMAETLEKSMAISHQKETTLDFQVQEQDQAEL